MVTVLGGFLLLADDFHFLANITSLWKKKKKLSDGHVFSCKPFHLPARWIQAGKSWTGADPHSRAVPCCPSHG